MLKFLRAGLLVSLLLASATAWAWRGNEDFEDPKFLSVGAGIASPSFSSGLQENPAGLKYNYETKFLGEAESQDLNFNSIGGGGRIFLGNGFVGTGLSIDTYFDRAAGGNATVFTYGLAAEIPGANLSIGVAGSYTLESSGGYAGSWSNYAYSTTTPWGLNIGAIYDPKSVVRVGATVYNVVAGVSAIGAGVGFDLSDWATIDVDAATSPRFQGTVIKPGFGVNVSDFHISAGWGFLVNGASTAWIPTSGSLGLGYRFGDHLAIEGYYNQYALFYLGLLVKI